MDFAYDDRTRELRAQLQAFMDEPRLPGREGLRRAGGRAARDGDPWQRPAVIDELKAAARQRGLWNLFLARPPGGAGPDQPAVRAAGGDHRAQPGDSPPRR